MAESDATGSMRPTDKYEAFPEAERVIGSGRFGRVKKVRRVSDGKIIACKSILYQNPETSKRTAEREYAILQQLKHPNVIEQIEVEWRPYKAKIYMEYCEGGSLQDLIDRHKEQEIHIPELGVWRILNQLASALVFCHLGLRIDKKGHISNHRNNILDWRPILHRDIKPANVFLRNRSNLALDTVKLGDFGLGYVLQNNAAPETYVGTAQYMAPEVSRVSVRSIHWTEHCDIFSLGCTVYALCALKPPFDYHMEGNSDPYSPFPEQYSTQLGNCIASCLAFYPETRPSAIRLFQQSQDHLNSFQPENLEPEYAADWSTQDQISVHEMYKSTVVLAERTTPVVEKTIAPYISEIATSIYWVHLRTLKGHLSVVWAVAFSPDGKQIASGSGDKTVRLWDSTTGAARGTLEGHSLLVLAVAFSLDAILLASGSGDGTVRLWDSTTGAARGTLEGHSGSVLAVAFSPDGKQIASGSWDGTVRLWDSATSDAGPRERRNIS